MNAAIKFGILGGVLLIITQLLFYIIGMEAHWSENVVTYSVMITVVILSCVYTKRENDGFLTLGQGVRSALKTSLILGFMAGLFFILYTYVINPEWAEIGLQKAREQMESQGLPDDQIEMGLQMSKKFMNPFLIAPISVVINAFFGLFIGLITSVVIKREPSFDSTLNS